MQSALDRRQAILEVLLLRRQDTIDNLANEFGVCRNTIKNDIRALSCSYPIYTTRGNGGGVSVEKSYYQGRRYLRPEQHSLLSRLAETLTGHDLEIMNSIFSDFASITPAC